MAAPQAFNVSVRPTATGVAGIAKLRAALGFRDDSDGMRARTGRLAYFPSPQGRGAVREVW
jgi:hypothetical protein